MQLSRRMGWGLWVAIAVTWVVLPFLIPWMERHDNRPDASATECFDEVYQMTYGSYEHVRCPHREHRLIRADEAGRVWVCTCDPKTKK